MTAIKIVAGGSIERLYVLGYYLRVLVRAVKVPDRAWQIKIKAAYVAPF